MEKEIEKQLSKKIQDDLFLEARRAYSKFKKSKLKRIARGVNGR